MQTCFCQRAIYIEWSYGWSDTQKPGVYIRGKRRIPRILASVIRSCSWSDNILAAEPQVYLSKHERANSENCVRVVLVA